MSKSGVSLGVFVGEDIWTFFTDIYNCLSEQYRTEIFKRKTYNLPLLYGRLNRWAYREGIRSILRRNDICFFEWSSEYLMIASKMPKYSKIITRLHSFELFDWADKINWDAVDKVILVSNHMRQNFIKHFPNQVHKTVVVNNGVLLREYKPFAPKKFNYNIGMVCRISPIKRVYGVVLMLRNLIDHGFDAHLHIAGEPEDLRYAAAVNSLVDKLQLQNNVHFYGYVSDIPKWLQQIDVYVSNSFWEGQQVALIEAMAAGCYCLSHFWGGVEEILPPENIFTTNNELLGKIIKFFQAGENTRHASQEIMRSIAGNKFDINKTIIQIQNIIEELS